MRAIPKQKGITVNCVNTYKIMFLNMKYWKVKEDCFSM